MNEFEQNDSGSGVNVINPKPHKHQEPGSELASIKAHGKVCGMRVFSWKNPEIEELHNFIMNVPFKVIWVAKGNQLAHPLPLMKSNSKKIHALVLYGKLENTDAKVIIQNIENFASTTEVESALRFAQAFQKTNAFFLFTTGGETTENDLRAFNDFLEKSRK